MAWRTKPLPEGLQRYRTTAVLDRASVPAALLKTHRVKAGVWGRLVTVRGKVRFCLDGGTAEEVVLNAGDTVVIEPETPHHVVLLEQESAFQVEFYRAPDEARGSAQDQS